MASPSAAHLPESSGQSQRPERPGLDSAFGPSSLDYRGAPRRRAGLGPGQRRGLWVLLVLAGMGLALLAGHLAVTPWIDAQWRADADGAVVLQSSPLPDLAPWQGQTLVALVTDIGGPLPLDAQVLHPLPRWQVDDTRRASQFAQQAALAPMLHQSKVQLVFADGGTVHVQPAPRGWASLGLGFYAASALALALAGVGAWVMLSRPQARNALYLLLCLGQVGHLLVLACATLPGLGTALALGRGAMLVSLALDALTSAAALHALLVHPRRQPRAHTLAAAVWLAALAGWCMVWRAPPPGLWWWAQAVALAAALAGWWMLRRSLRVETNPFAALIRRFTGLVAAGLVGVTALVALASLSADKAAPAAVLGAWAWSLVPSSLLLLAPFVSRSRQVLRGAALLAGAAALAAAAYLLAAAWLPLGRGSALLLSMAVALVAALQARGWARGHDSVDPLLGAERTFEQLYRAARDVQQQPGRYGHLLGQLLRDLFEPRELLPGQHDLAQARVLGGGVALEVPLRGGGRRPSGQAAPTLVLRFARGGQRLFTDDDARLADRLVEQLRRAVAYDKAVEHGRSEERQRIAQDLHDDIGARLLTLMYQAPTPAMEEYIRLTLKDLKTLTRGLAAGEHRLSHAVGEWKADLAQRLSAAQVGLTWTFNHDRDVALSMVQWSALTRVLRELVSNVLQHARARHVTIQITLQGPELLLLLADDGCGRNPQAWSHGLGLGGVRKRVKLIGGEVAWREQDPTGVVCEVRVTDFAERAG